MQSFAEQLTSSSGCINQSDKKHLRKLNEDYKQHKIDSITVDSAKKDLFRPVLTLAGGVTLVFPHEVSNRKFVYPVKKLLLSMFYSCQFCT